MMTPAKPSVSRRTACHAAESDAGASPSTQGAMLCVTSTQSAPASMPALNGRNAPSSNAVRSRSSYTTPVWLSAALP